MTPFRSIEGIFDEAESHGMRIGRTVSAQRARWLVGRRGRLGVRSRVRAGACHADALEKVEPFVVRVDNTTGVVDVVPVYAGRRGTLRRP